MFQTADQLNHFIYDFTVKFPKDEIFNVTSQLRRASLSIVLNIVEGSGKKITSQKEFCRFLKMSFGSLYEVEYLLNFCLSRHYITENEFQEVEKLRDKCGAELWKLIQSQEEP